MYREQTTYWHEPTDEEYRIEYEVDTGRAAIMPCPRHPVGEPPEGPSIEQIDVWHLTTGGEELAHPEDDLWDAIEEFVCDEVYWPRPY